MTETSDSVVERHDDDRQLVTHPWSAPEKRIICRLMEKTPVLGYPMQKREAANGDFEAVYLIPPEDKEKVVRQCWPYEGWEPDMESEVLDLHSRRTFKLKEAMVVWWDWRNILVCPDYLKTGGMVIDMVPPENTSCVGIVFTKSQGNPALVVTAVTREKKDQ